MITTFFIPTIYILTSLLPAVQGHMSLWHPSMYGFSQSWEPVQPLADKSFGEWWFHGNLGDRPKEVMTIVPGQDLSIEIACSKESTSWGGRSSPDACPNDAGAYHAGGTTGSASGWSGNSESNLIGCALAIAFKSDASSVQPEDFTVMSVQENCVRQRDTSFAIPANLPSCPDGECTCAWFWQGKNSALEMYMTGFRCTVEGGVVTSSYPSPASPKRGAISGPTQPMYWANSNGNLDYTPDWESKPTYNSAFGWSNGAQTSAFQGLGGDGGAQTSPNTTSSRQSSFTPTATSRNDWEKDDSATSTTEWGSEDHSRAPSWTSRTSRGGHQHQSTDAEAWEEATPTHHWYNHAADPTGSDSAETPAPTLTSTGKSCKRKRERRSRRRAHH